jgi:hypothetical protein
MKFKFDTSDLAKCVARDEQEGDDGDGGEEDDAEKALDGDRDRGDDES